MSKDALIRKVVHGIELLPEDKALQVLTFAEFKVSMLTKSGLSGDSQTNRAENIVYTFPLGGDDLYSINDIKRDC